MLKCVNVMMFLLYKKFLILYDYILYDYNLKLVKLLMAQVVLKV